MIRMKINTKSWFLIFILLLYKNLSLQVMIPITVLINMVNYKHKSINGGIYDLRLHDHNRKR